MPKETDVPISPTTQAARTSESSSPKQRRRGLAIGWCGAVASICALIGFLIVDGAVVAATVLHGIEWLLSAAWGGATALRPAIGPLAAIAFLVWLLWWLRWLKNSMLELTTFMSVLLAAAMRTNLKAVRASLEDAKRDPQFAPHVAPLTRILNPSPQKSHPVLPEATWGGCNFCVYSANASWSAVPGVYVLARQDDHGEWKAVYIGQTPSLLADPPGNKEWFTAQVMGATHIHARVEWDDDKRKALAKELIHAYLPSMNIDR